MVHELEQGRHPGFQLDFRRSVLVFSQSLDEMTQAQLSDEIQIHLPIAVTLDLDEVQQVGCRDVGDAGQNLVGRDGSRFHAGIDGRTNRTSL